MSLDSIVCAFRDGQSPEAVLDDFDTLSLEQVYGAITYYLSQQPAVDAYLLRQKKRWEEMKRAAPPRSQKLQERLDAARQRVGSLDC